MSQLQVTGEAKIRDIQGPVVANSGVITALDGAASQYVRGDGTLADFPTSTGGGSSVSYYLNSSVSQGTIGGVAYRQLGKTPIAGAGTDITISANGYVASYITDANDPALLEVPAGNFNCEFYFSVNNNTGNPFTYAEVYKYDGTTFTLIGTSVGVPEYINQGTVINPYYFAVPVASSVLSITDRIAIRIYVNVDGRTVTLHTENNHLCQVVTTFSKGLTSLNNLTRQVQFLATGTSGTDFNISSVTATHTFNLPIASATNTGKLSSTDWSTFNSKQPAGNYVTLDTTQTITAAKTFSGSVSFNSALSAPIIVNFGAALTKGNTPSVSGSSFSNIYTSLGNNNLVIADNSNTSKLQFQAASSYDYTFPASSGTVALTSDLSSYVPYTGATTNVNLGVYSLTANQLIAGGASTDNVATLTTYDQGHALKLKGSTGDLFFVPYFSPSIGARITAQNSAASANTPLSFYASNFYFNSNVNFGSTLGNGTYTYTLPSATGTLALTSNLSAYLPLTGGTLTGALSGTSATFSSLTSGYITKAGASGLLSNSIIYDSGGSIPKIVINGTTVTDGNLLNLQGDQSSVNIGLVLNNTNATYPKIYGLQNVNNNLIFYDYSANATRLTIASTGAATFSSSVTMGGDLVLTPTDSAISFTSGAGRFFTGGNERMRITSGGNVLIGTTSVGGKFYTYNTTETNTIKAHDANGSTTSDGIMSVVANRNTTNNTFYAYGYYNIDAGAFKFRVADSGNVTNTNNSYGAISDIKLKENITDATPKLDDLLKVKIKNFNYIGSEEKQLGVIAQELEEVFPSMIEIHNDTDKEGNDLGTTTKSVKYSVFVPMLIKAIQELTEKVNELESKIK